MYDTNADLPDVIRLGLTPDMQSLVRGMVATLVYDDRHEVGLAVSKVQKAIEAAGYRWNGQRWQSALGKVVADGVIVKKDNDERLVFGWANVVSDESGRILVDRQGDFIDDPGELEKAAYHYVLHSRDAGDMHLRRGVGTLVESMMFTPEKIAKMGIPQGLIPVGWWIGFHVNDNNTWEAVKKEDYVGFSIHGSGTRKSAPIDERHTRDGA